MVKPSKSKSRRRSVRASFLPPPLPPLPSQHGVITGIEEPDRTSPDTGFFLDWSLYLGKRLLVRHRSCHGVSAPLDVRVTEISPSGTYACIHVNYTTPQWISVRSTEYQIVEVLES